MRRRFPTWLLLLLLFTAIPRADAQDSPSMRTLGKNDHVLVIAEAFYSGMLADILAKQGCTVDAVVDVEAGRNAIRDRKPSVLVIAENALPSPKDARELRSRTSAALVVMTSGLLVSSTDAVTQATEADAILLMPFKPEDVLDAIWRAQNPGQRSPRELREEHERTTEEKRQARIGGLSVQALLQVEPPLASPEEALEILVSRVASKINECERADVTRLEKDILLIHSFWSEGLAVFTDTQWGDSWEVTADSLSRAGFEKEASAVRDAFVLLSKHGAIDDEQSRSRTRSALGERERVRWESFQRIADASARKPRSIRQLFEHARRHSSELRLGPCPK